MIDSHCHLDHEPLLSDLDNVIKRAKNSGVNKFLTICTNTNSFNNILKFIDNYDEIYATFGIHPHDADKELLNISDIIKFSNSNKKVIGVGESGLDFYYNNSKKNDQIESFNNHIEASIKLNKPIIVHSRNAEDETFSILENFKNYNPKILMHCFTGSMNFAKKLLKLNAFFSASGILTFKNSTDLQCTFKEIPNENLLIETDSPFLAPVPMRGKKNEPSFVSFTLEKLAYLKCIESSLMDYYTTNNFNKLFFHEN